MVAGKVVEVVLTELVAKLKALYKKPALSPNLFLSFNKNIDVLLINRCIPKCY